MNQPPSLGAEYCEHSCHEVILQWNVCMFTCVADYVYTVRILGGGVHVC